MNPNENHEITLTEGATMTAAYRTSVATQTNPILAFAFSKKAMGDLIAQEGAAGVRFYRALDKENNEQTVAVAIDSDDNDLYEGLIMDRALHCPPACSTANRLNS